MTAPENLRVTSRSNNRSKGSKKAADWDREGVDRDRLMDADRVARRHIERKVQRAAFIDRGKRLAVTGVAEGAKMGLQQLIGFVVAELVNGCFDEVGEMLNEGGDRQPRALARELKTRSRRVMERVVARWREALDAFKDGALSGFFSNLVTFLINRIWRTGKNVVRALREGVFGLGRALKMGLRADSTEQGWHDASKVLVTSGLVVGAVFVEEALQGAMGGSVLLLPLAPLLAPVIAGLLAGLATVLATWLLDRMDLFGAVEMQRAGEVDAWLDALLDAPRRPTGLSPSSLQLA
jgi:hypothetical protein